MADPRLSGDAFGPRPHASHRAALRLGLSVSVAIALAGCHPQPQQAECISTATGERLQTNSSVSRALHGFTGVDAQGFERRVTYDQATGWKCRALAAQGGSDG